MYGSKIGFIRIHSPKFYTSLFTALLKEKITRVVWHFICLLTSVPSYVDFPCLSSLSSPSFSISFSSLLSSPLLSLFHSVFPLAPCFQSPSTLFFPFSSLFVGVSFLLQGLRARNFFQVSQLSQSYDQNHPDMDVIPCHGSSVTVYPVYPLVKAYKSFWGPGNAYCLNTKF